MKQFSLEGSAPLGRLDAVVKHTIKLRAITSCVNVEHMVSIEQSFDMFNHCKSVNREQPRSLLSKGDPNVKSEHVEDNF